MDIDEIIDKRIEELTKRISVLKIISEAIRLFGTISSVLYILIGYWRNAEVNITIIACTVILLNTYILYAFFSYEIRLTKRRLHECESIKLEFYHYDKMYHTTPKNKNNKG